MTDRLNASQCDPRGERWSAYLLKFLRLSSGYLTRGARRRMSEKKSLSRRGGEIAYRGYEGLLTAGGSSCDRPTGRSYDVPRVKCSTLRTRNYGGSSFIQK